ncbi:MAG: AbrB family transcriptional regulator [Pseudomonadota bacterium]
MVVDLATFAKFRGFAIALIPAAIGGAFWHWLGLPLGWLMGAAIVTGICSFNGLKVELPKLLYLPSLAIIGAGVGLTITPSVAAEIARWFPFMAIMGFSGVLLAALVTPIVARRGGMKPSTAFFALMPGGVIEMANIGEPHGADRTTIAALHAIRVALVVGLLPLGLYTFFGSGGAVNIEETLTWIELAEVLPVALLGGWIGAKVKMPASWLLGSLLAVGLVTMTGFFGGRIHDPLMAIAQVIVGMSLGAKFLRERLASIPRAIAAGTPALVSIIAVMAALGIAASFVLPFDIPTMVLAFSIGGLAEMVLTARALELNMAIVAAFQAIRAILVNASAGVIWNKIAPLYGDASEEEK